MTLYLETDYADSQGKTTADTREKVTCYTTQQVESWSLCVLLQKPLSGGYWRKEMLRQFTVSLPDFDSYSHKQTNAELMTWVVFKKHYMY